MPIRSLGRAFGYDLALDPGSESVRALARSGEIAVVPSVLAGVKPSLGGFLRSELVGEAALAIKSRAGADEGPGPHVRMARPISRGSVRDIGAAERLFAHVFREAPRRTWGARPRVLVGLGACSSPVERGALTEALERAGARSVSLVPALPACALALERMETTSRGPRPSGTVVRLIVELGAERTGVGLASSGGVVADSSRPWGFSDLDRVLAGQLSRRGIVVSPGGAGDLRKALGFPAPAGQGGEQPSARKAAPLGVRRHDGTIADAEDILPRDVGEALSPFVAHLADEIRSVLSRAPEGAADDLLEFGAVLAGGPAATPGLAELLAADLGLPVRSARDAANLRVKGLALLMDEPELLALLALEA